MYKFIKTKDPANDYDISEVNLTILSSEATVSDMLEHFQKFMGACGFVLKGQLEIVEERNND